MVVSVALLPGRETTESVVAGCTAGNDCMASEPVTGVVSPLGSAAGLQAIKSTDATRVKLMSKYFMYKNVRVVN